jgi:RNA polymerase sigma-70 factor (ECF subfamily)
MSFSMPDVSMETIWTILVTIVGCLSMSVLVILHGYGSVHFQKEHPDLASFISVLQCAKEYATDGLLLAFSITGNHEDAQDAVQTAYNKMMDSETVPRNVRAFFLKIVGNTGRNIVRARKPTVPIVDNEELLASEPDPTRQVEAADTSSHLGAALDQLPGAVREPLLMHYEEGKTHQEIADSLGLPKGTVNSRIINGRDTLHDLLSEKLGEGVKEEDIRFI